MRLPDETSPEGGADAALPPHAARLHGLHRGADVSGAVEVTVEPLGLRLALAGGLALPVPWAALDGVHHDGTTLTLYLMGDEVLELDDVADAAGLARTVTQRACRLGELTLAMRGLGSARANPGSEHQRFYAPLLAARRALEAAHSPVAQWAAVDAKHLGRELRATLAAFAAERYADAPADRRALEAELLDYADGLLRALDALDAARDAARAAPPDARFAWWREWVTALRLVFAEHDRAWIAALPALCDPRGQRGRFWRRLLRWGRGPSAIAAMALPALGAVPSGIAAQGDAGVRETVRVPGAHADSLAARGFDVVFVHAGVPLVVVGPAERARLLREGWAPEALREGVEARRRAGLAPGAPAQAAATRTYRPFDDPARGLRAWLDSLAAARPDVVRLDTLGESWEGRPLLAVRIGRVATDVTDDPARANVVFLGTYHAREWIATEMALRLVRHLATSGDARTRALVAARDVWVMPVVNPDGYQHSHVHDRLWRKNRRPGGEFPGVDLNRNHDVRWGWDDRGSSGAPASETYRGPSPASEPEVKAVQLLHERVRPIVGVSYHSFSGLVLYPPGFAAGLLPQDLGIYRALAGTDLHPAVRDRVPGTTRDWYHPGPGWQLYVTNGDYLDWASAQGTLAFTTELTSGCFVDCARGYYGFEFPDEEPLIEQVFQDNLPFALDALEAAGDPRTFVSRTTRLGVPHVTLESASPIARVRVPTSVASTAVLRVATSAGRDAVLPVRRDSVDSRTWEARLISGAVGARPAELELSAAGIRLSWRTVLAGGGEGGDAGWNGSSSWVSTSAGASPLAGRGFWESRGEGELQSPPVVMPTDADTVVLSWWQQHTADAFSAQVAGEVRVAVDGGAAVPVAIVSGNAEAWYPEELRIGGVRGRTLRVSFAARLPRWRLDEVMLLAEGSTLPVASEVRTLALRPSANPLRGPRVTFAWPADAGAGEIAVFDFGGRRVWQRAISAGEPSATWDAAAQSLANGAYLVVARAGARTGRLTLYVAR